MKRTQARAHTHTSWGTTAIPGVQGGEQMRGGSASPRQGPEAARNTQRAGFRGHQSPPLLC